MHPLLERQVVASLAVVRRAARQLDRHPKVDLRVGGEVDLREAAADPVPRSGRSVPAQSGC